MGINFADLFWAGVVCGVVLVGTVAGIAYNNRGLGLEHGPAQRHGRIEVRIGPMTMVDAGVGK